MKGKQQKRTCIICPTRASVAKWPMCRACKALSDAGRDDDLVAKCVAAWERANGRPVTPEQRAEADAEIRLMLERARHERQISEQGTV